MDIIAEKKLKTASQIYYCLVKSVSNNQCVIIFNNEQYTVPFFGSTPIPNKTYILFLPQNNMNQAFIIGEGGVEIKDDEVSQHETWSSSKIRDFIYPVGSIYMSTNNISPATIFGGTWVQIQDRFLLAAGTTYTAGDTGGQSSYAAADMPAHTHDRGTMEITGSAVTNKTYSGTPYASNSFSGAFTAKSVSGTQYYLSGRTSGNGWYDFDFKASNAWTGETSQSGTNPTATIMPPYLVVYVWTRTA